MVCSSNSLGRLSSALRGCRGRAGFKLVGRKMLQALKSILAEHCHDIWRQPLYPALVSYLGQWWPWSKKAQTWPTPQRT